MSKIIGLTCGVFDYTIHKGHIEFLKMCNMLCDELYIAVVPDCVCEQIKRKSYYIQEVREQNLIDTGLVRGCIDFSVGLYSEIVKFDFDLYVFGKDQGGNIWTRELVALLFDLGIPTISTFEERIESTSDLLRTIGYI